MTHKKALKKIKTLTIIHICICIFLINFNKKKSIFFLFRTFTFGWNELSQSRVSHAEWDYYKIHNQQWENINFVPFPTWKHKFEYYRLQSNFVMHTNLKTHKYKVDSIHMMIYNVQNLYIIYNIFTKYTIK